ncbi:hypothetical protein ACFFJB_14330 [Camelimonas abortus]|uniref:hypothetical protein n=1 Tax=Camelimonas abortus TaxID=1017184 RepID=UPI0035E61CE3
MAAAPVRDVTFQLLREPGVTSISGNPGSTGEMFLKNFPAGFRCVHVLLALGACVEENGVASRRRCKLNGSVVASAGAALQ